jgi:A/G-specific adenine glycosylase
MKKRSALPSKHRSPAGKLLAPSLLTWYARNGRDLPWRRTRDPYRILVSEMMLQQTQVARVLKYYERFLKAFPDVVSLARASVDQVLKLWEGMGYYARARHLHRAAGMIVDQHGGKIPSRMETLQDLPGVGYNTAASVASLAYGRPQPVLDGNAIRVLCRLGRLSIDPRSSSGRKRLVDLASPLIPDGKAGPFNQALMDLGALVCRPTNPDCPACPLAKICSARTAGDPTRFPRRRSKPRRPHYDITAGIIWKGRRLLIAQRLPDDLLGGLWEFPGGKRENGETLEDCLRREIREELGITIRVDRHFISLDHAFSHFRFTLHAFHCTYQKGTPRTLGCADFRWIRISDLDAFALPRVDQKLARALKNREKGSKTPFE